VAEHFPDLESKPLQPNDLEAMYMPVWFINDEATGKVTCLDVEAHEAHTVIQRGSGLTPP